MKLPFLASSIIAVLSCGVAAWAQTATPTIESMPPVVVKSVPQSGAKGVVPGTVEVKVTFSKEMADQSWSWSSAWANSAPQIIGKPKYEADKKTCVVKANLEPGKTYAWWINSGKFNNFRDSQGKPAVPYLLIFETSK